MSYPTSYSISYHIYIESIDYTIKLLWCILIGNNCELFFFVFDQTAPSGSGPSHSRGFYITHNDTPQSVGLLWKSDQLVAETSDNTQHSQQTYIHAPGGIRTHNLSRRAAADLRLRPRGHWDWRALIVYNKNNKNARYIY